MKLLDTSQLSAKLGLSRGALAQLRRREKTFPNRSVSHRRYFGGTNKT